MATKTVPISQLVEDFDLYPRHGVDSTHVADLARALESGHKLPAPVIDDKTLRIVDGFHRVRANRRAFGDQAEISVVTRRYKTEADIVKDAVQSNAAHGRRLDQQDRTRCALMLERHKIPAKDIALTLHTTQDRVEKLLVRVVIVEGQKEPAKPVAWPSNSDSKPRRLTKEQYTVAKGSSGWKPVQTVTHLTKELEAGVLNLKDEGLTEKLWALHDMIAKKVPTRGRPG